MKRPTLVSVDLSDINSPRQLHAALAAALGFPSFYGMNWDAFQDAITGLVDMPQQLELRGWPAFAARLPDEAAILQRILARMAQDAPDGAAQLRYA
ncbi:MULTISPECIES: barstar family protein [unclassified Janthinobacterium]|uniref:barstar family protein n=1 Tax=unclassified Janthinobacterium TaxID=2610881 RepID=UPI002712C5C0|nr:MULTISPECIES: barstar family protein [unclassified Janthinobacterium]MDO8070588.1 barstar family protein [Janthinobacterium sp. SUN176]MED5617058.1 barstar family protein [Janthinobacterium sp. P210005]